MAETVFETHPNARGANTACHARGFHYVQWDEDKIHHSPCVDCGSVGADRLVLQDAKYAPPKRPVSTSVPSGDLGHDPSADFAARMRAREIPVSEHLKGAPKATVPMTITEEQFLECAKIYFTRDKVISLAEAYGVHVLDSEGKGNTLHLSDELQKTQAENEALLTRCKLAEASAASAIKELNGLKTQAPEPAPATPPKDGK